MNIKTDNNNSSSDNILDSQEHDNNADTKQHIPDSNVGKINISDPNEMWICGKVLKPHGLSGLVSFISFFSDRTSLESHKIFFDRNMKSHKIKILKPLKKSVNGTIFITKIDDIQNINDLDNVLGLELMVKKSELPGLSKDNEFYINDLIGMKVLTESKAEYGFVKYVHNFGAGDLIEITCVDDNKDIMMPFTKEIFPHIDIQSKILIISISDIDVINED